MPSETIDVKAMLVAAAKMADRLHRLQLLLDECIDESFPSEANELLQRMRSLALFLKEGR